MREKEKAVTKERQISRVFKDKLKPPKVVEQQIIISAKHMAEESRGEMTQLEQILTTCIQAMLLAPLPTMPAPTSALITV